MQARPTVHVTLGGPVRLAGPRRTRRTTPHGTGIIAPMSERGLPTEGAPACPFVAFEDDRDGRATAPDHRHRCFAEPRPAPRALAHQEAYCLSSAFPVCPTFQDWARREAAAARPAAGERVRRPARSRPRAGRCRPRREPRTTDAGRARSPRLGRPTQRDWAAPPPWVGDEPDGGRAAARRTRLPARDDERARRAATVGLEQRVAAGSRAAPRTASPARTRTSPDPAVTDGDRRPATRRRPRRLRGRAGAAAAGAYVAGSATARPSTASRAAPPPRRDAPAPRSSATRRASPSGRIRRSCSGPPGSVRAATRPTRRCAPAWACPRWAASRRSRSGRCSCCSRRCSCSCSGRPCSASATTTAGAPARRRPRRRPSR